MAEFVYFYSNADQAQDRRDMGCPPGQASKTCPRWDPKIPDDQASDGPATTAPRRARELGARAIGVKGLNDFEAELKNLKGTKIDRMVIESHGRPGAVFLGKDTLSSTSLIRLKGQGHEDLFEANARVLLNGCNVAENAVGRQFLLDLARLFLFKGGGRVGGGTAKGYTEIGSDKVFHLTGTQVYAYINKGGTKTRIAVGTELSSPVGQWKVTVVGDDVYFYFFDKDGTVRWYELVLGHMWGGDPGKGSWSAVDGQLQVTWASGARETWDLPLFTKEQPAVWHRKDGVVKTLEAEKMVTGRRLD
jgi:hypothetical protein